MSQKFGCRHVHQIPIIGLLYMVEIERKDIVATSYSVFSVFKAFACQFAELRYKNEKATKTYLMPFAHQKRWHLVE